MALKHLTTALPLIAVVAAAHMTAAFSTPNTVSAPNPGSPHVMTNAPPPAGTAALPDRTTRLILAQDSTRDSTRGAEPRPRSGNSPASREPAPAQSDPGENRDLDRRSSPEAANDLFQLLKQAGPKQSPKPK
jgi:hypothetical protein